MVETTNDKSLPEKTVQKSPQLERPLHGSRVNDGHMRHTSKGNESCVLSHRCCNRTGLVQCRAFILLTVQDQRRAIHRTRVVNGIVQKQLEPFCTLPQPPAGELRTQRSEIEWRKIIGLRNRIVHNYFNIDIEILWEIIQKDLPDFKSKLSLIRT